MFDYRAAILENLPAALKKRTKNSEKSLTEFNEIFSESERHLLSVINGPKSDGNASLDKEIWTSLLESVREIKKSIKEPECLALSLSLLQLQLITCSKEEKEETFTQAAELLVELEAPTCASQMTAQLNILSTIFPLLLTNSLLKQSELPLLQHAKSILNSAFKTENRPWTQSLKPCLAVLRFTQVFLLACSQHESEMEEDEDEIDLDNALKLGISCVPNSPSISALRDEGTALFREFIRLPKDLSSPCVTAWLNLLQPITQYRPAFLPTLIPALLSFLESSSFVLSASNAAFTVPQRRNILHCLKASLSVLISVPKAEKFSSLLMEALDKCAAAELNFILGTTVAAKGRKRPQTTTTDAAEEAEEDYELLASLGGIGDRSSAAFASANEAKEGTATASVTPSSFENLASEVLLRELIKIPHPLVVEMVVRMLGTWTEEQIRGNVQNRWPRRIDSSVASDTKAPAFQLTPEAMYPELPGEVIHHSMARILQTLSDLTEYHLSSRRDDLIVPLGQLQSDKENYQGSTKQQVCTKGILVPLVRTCRLVALITAHVGSVRSAALMDPERRRKRLEKRLDPRFQKQQDDDDEEDDEEDEKSVNQIVLSWINQDLAMRFDFVWWWLEAVWVREGKQGINTGEEEDNEDGSDYGRLFDDVVGLAGQFFTANPLTTDTESLSRVLDVFLHLPRLNPSFFRNLLYPLLEEVERFRSVILDVLATLFFTRPGTRPMLADLVMTLAGSDDAGLRHATIDQLLLKRQLYPSLKSLSERLESFSLELLDSLNQKSTTATVTKEPSLKKLKLDSSTDVRADIFGDSDSDEEVDEVEEVGEDFDAEIDLFLGLLKKSPERLLNALILRHSRLPLALQSFLADSGLPGVVAHWTGRELRAINAILLESAGKDAVVLRIVNLILEGGTKLFSPDSTPDADLVDFYDDFAHSLAAKITASSLNGSLIPALLPWILRDRADVPAFNEIFLPKLVMAVEADALPAVAEKICLRPELYTPTQLFVQLHLLQNVPLKTQIDAIQICFAQAAVSSKGIFNLGVIATGLTQLTEMPLPLPDLLGRSLLQSVSLSSSTGNTGNSTSTSNTTLTPAFLLSLLSKLISKRAWDQPRLWEGWTRSLRALLPASLSILLQLPPGELERTLQGSGADLRVPLKEYLYNQPPSVRNRYLSILKTLERK